MVGTFVRTKQDLDYNRLNLHLAFVIDLAECIDRINLNINRCNRGSFNAYDNLLGDLILFRDLLDGVKLKIDSDDLKKIDLLINISKKIKYFNFDEGLNYLRECYRMLLSIARKNNLIFGKKIKGMSFKGFVEEEIG